MLHGQSVAANDNRIACHGRPWNLAITSDVDVGFSIPIKSLLVGLPPCNALTKHRNST